MHTTCQTRLTAVNKSKKVLYADDDLDDKTWIVEAWQTMEVPVQIEFIDNGRQALDYLVQHVDDMPALIVLDLNMPEMDGRQTLQKIKNEPQFRHIPVVIVSTSTSKLDTEVCKRLGATLFLTKPDTHAEWQDIVQQLQPYLTSNT
jgi:CheY-like chemotaxis protein